MGTKALGMWLAPSSMSVQGGVVLWWENGAVYAHDCGVYSLVKGMNGKQLKQLQKGCRRGGDTAVLGCPGLFFSLCAGIKLRAWPMSNKCSVTELHPSPALALQL